MDTKRYTEWEKLCEELNVAQGEYMELHGMLVKKAVGAGGLRQGPSEGDFSRAKSAKERVERLQKQVDDFLKDHVSAAD